MWCFGMPGVAAESCGGPAVGLTHLAVGAKSATGRAPPHSRAILRVRHHGMALQEMRGNDGIKAPPKKKVDWAEFPAC